MCQEPGKRDQFEVYIFYKVLRDDISVFFPWKAIW